MMTYSELKQKQQDELNSFEGIFFAFSNEQFGKGMEKLGLKPGEKEKILSLGAGGYILKDRKDDFLSLFDRHRKELKELKENGKLLEALVYELRNHEFCITGSADDALEALGLTREDVSAEILNQACAVARNEN